MASIFDMFGGSPQSQGLLAAAAQILQASGPSRTPTGLGAILGGGISAYQQTEQQARQLGQQGQLRDLQIKGAEADLAQQQRALEKQQALSAAAQRAYRTPGTQAASLPGGPTPENAARIGEFEGDFDTKSYIDQVMAIDPAMGFQLQQSLKKAGPKYDSGITWVNGPGGQPVAVRTADDGSIKQLEGLTPRDKLELANLGGRSEAYNPYGLKPGQSFTRTATPGEQLSAQVQREGFNRADARADRANPANKPLPAAALKMQNDGLEAIATATGINSQLSNIRDQIKGGKLSFGPVSNLVNQARNAAGMSSEESRNFASFRSTLEKIRNDSLRLNAGVQTDGDAQRAWNELFQNINDTDLVMQRLEEIERINVRGAELQKLKVDGVRGNYGHEPFDFSRYDQPAGGTPQQPAQQPRQTAAGGKVATLSDIAATARASGRSTAEVTAALKAKGYTIGGQ